MICPVLSPHQAIITLACGSLSVMSLEWIRLGTLILLCLYSSWYPFPPVYFLVKIPFTLRLYSSKSSSNTFFFFLMKTRSYLSEWLKLTSQEITDIGEDVEKGKPLLHCWWEWKQVWPLWKTVCRFLKKLKIEQLYNPAISLLGIYPKDTIIQIWKGTWIPKFKAALSIITRLWKDLRCPSSDEWIKKMWCVHTCTHTQCNITQPLKRMKSCHLQWCGWS